MREKLQSAKETLEQTDSKTFNKQATYKQAHNDTTTMGEQSKAEQEKLREGETKNIS